MINFAFVIPTRNSVNTLKQAVASMAFQSYGRWRAVVVDDCSTDGTADFLVQTVDAFGVRDKFTVIRNTERKWEIANTLIALSEVSPDEIVCRLDLDDYLCDLNALEITAKAYEHFKNVDVVYSKHRWFDEERLTNFNISAQLPPGADPYVHPWVTSHFKTFRRSLLNGVSDENFRGQDGEYFKRIGDQAFMLPALKNARDWLFLEYPFYAYRCSLKQETFQTDDAKFQAQEAEFLRRRGYVT